MILRTRQVPTLAKTKGPNRTKGRNKGRIYHQ